MDSIIFIFFKIRIHSSFSFKFYSFLFDQTGRFLARGGAHLRMLSGLCSNFFYLFAQNWNHFEEVADDTIVGRIEDGCFRVFINGQNHF